MKRSAAVLAFLVLASLSLGAQSPSRAGGPPREDASALLPAEATGDDVAATADRQRIYFVNGHGDLCLYHPADRTTTRLADGPAWNLNLSASGTALAYAKGGATRGQPHVWVLPLDGTTGLGRTAERQLSTDVTDTPAISPDGKSVAFARDDATGVGQSVVVAPLGGGAGHVVAAGLPSSVASIRWTPDSRLLYLGVNPPVACVPGWSCLPLAPALREPPGTIRRVAVTGGPMTTVATGHNVTPGLSPDGKTLLYLDTVTGPTTEWAVANADGTRRETLTLPNTDTPIGWLRGSTVLIRTTVMRVRGLSLIDLDPRSPSR